MTLDTYLKSRLNKVFEHSNHLDVFICVFRSDEYGQDYTLSLRQTVQSQPWFKELHAISISRYTFFKQTELWDDIFEEIRLVITFLS